LPKYRVRFENHPDRFRVKKCKISTKYTIKHIFIKHPTYFSLRPFVLRSLFCWTGEPFEFFNQQVFICAVFILHYFIRSNVLLTTIKCVLMGSEAGQMTESQNHNEHLEFTGIIGILARAIPVFFMWKLLSENYLHFGHSLFSILPSQS
jgi:hypothetical protein